MGVTIKIKDDRAAFERIATELASGRIDGLIGVRQGQRGVSAEPGDADITEIAIFNEFGTATIEPRPAFRRTFDAKKGSYIELAKKEIGQVVDGKQSLVRATGRIAIQIEGDIAEGIIDLSDPGNKQSTIDRKGSANPLVDTSRYHQSIDSQVTVRGKVGIAWSKP